MKSHLICLYVMLFSFANIIVLPSWGSEAMDRSYEKVFSPLVDKITRPAFKQNLSLNDSGRIIVSHVDVKSGNAEFLVKISDTSGKVLSDVTYGLIDWVPAVKLGSTWIQKPELDPQILEVAQLVMRSENIASSVAELMDLSDEADELLSQEVLRVDIPQIVASFDKVRDLLLEKKPDAEVSIVGGKTIIKYTLDSGGRLSSHSHEYGEHKRLIVTNREAGPVSTKAFTNLTRTLSASGDRISIMPMEMSPASDGYGFAMAQISDSAYVVGLVPHSKAAQAGLNIGDRILRIDGMDLTSLKADWSPIPLGEYLKKSTAVKMTIVRIGGSESTSIEIKK